MRKFYKFFKIFNSKPKADQVKEQFNYLTSKVFPLTIPIHVEEDDLWKPHFFFKGPVRNVNHISCHVSWLKSGHIPHPPHTHKEEEILILLSGEVDLFLPEDESADGEKRRRLNAREFVYYPTGFPHSIQTVSQIPAHYIMIKWSEPELKQTPLVPFQHHVIDLSDEGFNLSKPFALRRQFEGPTAYLGKLHCHLTRLAPGAGYEAHADDHDVVIIMLEGVAETLGKNVRPHDVIFYAAGEEHGMHNPGQVPARYIVFSFHRIQNSASKSPVEKNLPVRDFYRPRQVTLDASTVCQLTCQTCPTSRGVIKRNIGAGFLKFSHFRRFLDDHPWVSEIRLSNWGEALLNPELSDILKYAHQKKVKLEMSANLNTISEEVLEGLVKFGVQKLKCSLDGTSQETYSIYRVNGHFDQVIKNINKINEFKKQYNSSLPLLQWQFIAFGHNEHEIAKARIMAAELKMSFSIKLSWDDLYFDTFSPVKDRELIRAQTGEGVADRQEYEEKFKKNYIEQCCHNLWLDPKINFDGKLLGCCVNHWGDFGNVFETGLEICLKSEKMSYAKAMLMGLKAARNDIPCTTCKVYATRKKYHSYVVAAGLKYQ
jgi:MoaA/NifB/PqqE/SkfB family radical SAM enzyme/mannose-6-phosphate isomerase-like protein (cupin superfamily)